MAVPNQMRRRALASLSRDGSIRNMRTQAATLARTLAQRRVYAGGSRNFNERTGRYGGGGGGKGVYAGGSRRFNERTGRYRGGYVPSKSFGSVGNRLRQQAISRMRMKQAITRRS